jgi:methylthioribose-1-phosphate isomerase
VLTTLGRDDYGQATRVALVPPGTRVVNYAFDITPSRLVSGLITERGIARAAEWLVAMFPNEQRMPA